MPFFFDMNHYAAISSLLLAGDVQARFIINEDHTVIVVKLSDGREAVWGNSTRVGNSVAGATWRFTLLEADGFPGGWTTDLRMDAMPEEVAHLIATFEYPDPTTIPEEAPVVATYVEDPAENEVGC